MDEVMTVGDAFSSSVKPSLFPLAPDPLLTSNLPLISAFLAGAIAQYKERKWESKRMFGSGGMPSSHSATVTALALAIALQEGSGGPAFAVAVVFACVVMYDASGVRLHAGLQAELLNQIVCEFPPEHPLSSIRPLRDSLGHTPLQSQIQDQATMTKKKGSTATAGAAAGSKVAVVVCAMLLTLAILIFHSDEFKLQSSNFTYQFRNNGFGEDSQGFQSPPKIAFLFLTRSNLPLDFIWASFFKNGDQAKFSIYIHSQPGFVYDKSTTKSPFFYGRQLNNSIQVLWGDSTMIEAERLLFGAALADPANQRFVLLSDSCIPLHNFSHTYRYLMSSTKSFVDSFLNVGEGRYNPEMSPFIQREKWRKGSQWIALVRRHAEVVVNDVIIFPLFTNLCKIRDLENELERRTLTYTMWNSSIPKGDKRSWHPVTFQYSDATPLIIKEMKEIDHIDFESEHRTEWCRVNSMYTPCFLFARKFTPGAALRVLKNG
ncbi:yuiD, partial [Cucurbita argyrosperma subsp. argyrosperma]